MNNQEVIDNFIIETGGVLRNHKDFFIKDGNIGLWFPCGSLDSLHLCTTEEFQQRARELGYGVKTISLDSTEWYDYETQKALRLPPVGEYCQVYINGWYNCYIVGLDDLGGCVFRKDGEYMQRITDDSFRPSDWNRKAEAERKRVVDAVYDEAIKAGCVDFGQWLTHLYNAGFLRMPEWK